MPSRAHFLLYLIAFLLLGGRNWAATPPLAPGDLVRLTKGETLIFEGKNLASAAKGQQFTMVRSDLANKSVYVEYFKKDGSRIEASLPAEVVEPAPAEGWSDLLRGVEAFRDQNFALSRTLLARAAQDATYKALASAIAPRLNAAAISPNPAAALPGLRDLAAGLCKMGHLSLGLAVDQGADRLAARSTVAVPTKIEKEDVTKKVAVVTRAAALCRQAYAVHRTKEAAALAKEGLDAEPIRPDLLALQKKIAKDLSEAEDRLADAERMRKLFKGEVHAITALQLGLKLSADHPGLVALKNEMSGALEERTAPLLTPALLTAARAQASPILEEGRKLYTTRCVECHDLEVIDSRSVSGWEKMVGGMAGRAHLNGEQQSRIVQYLTVALNGTAQ